MSLPTSSTITLSTKYRKPSKEGLPLQGPNARTTVTIEVVSPAMAEILRQKTPAERLAMVDAMWRFARDMIRANVRRENPHLSEEEIQRIVARRLSHGAV